MKKVKAEINQAAAHHFPFNLDVLLLQMPTPRAYHQCGNLVVELVGLVLRWVYERDGAIDGIAQVDLAFHIVFPTGRVAVL